MKFKRRSVRTWSATSWVVADRDIVEARKTFRVNEWVQKAERWLSICDSNVIQQAHEGCECWRRGRSPTDETCLTLEEDLEIVCQRGYVRISLEIGQ